MKKTKLTRSLLAACSIVALSAVMYGCTGDGSKNDLTATQDDLAQERADHADTQADLDTANADVTRLTGELDTANGEVTRIQGLLDTASGDVTRLMGELDTANGEVTRLEGALTQAETDRDHYKGMVEAAMGTNVPAGVAAEAMGLAMAIARDDMDMSSIAALADLDADPFAVDGGEVTERPVTMDNENDDFAAGAAPATILGWAGATYAHMVEDDADTMDADESVTTTVVSYTNIEAAKNQAYSAYYPANASSGPGGSDPWEAVTSVADEDGVLNLNEQDIAGNSGLFTGNFGITAAHQTIPAPTNDTTTEDVNEAMVEITGSFHGIPGTFACDSGCSRTSDGDGNLSLLGGAWTFTPTVPEGDDLDDIMVAGVIPDADYIDFGYWIVESQGNDGTEYEVGTYAMGEAEHTGVNNITGTASYSGAATGVYMDKTFAADGSPNPRSSGQFRADVGLTATFGQTMDDPATDVDEEDSIAPNMLNTISGTISDFRNAAGDAINAAWKVELMRAEIDGTTDNHYTGMTTGGGMYAGSFFGTDTAVAPTSTAGTFDAHFANGHVAGAFGADKE